MGAHHVMAGMGRLGRGLRGGAGRGHAFLEVGLVGLDFLVAGEESFGSGFGVLEAGLVRGVWLHASSSEACLRAVAHLLELGLHGIRWSGVGETVRHRCRWGPGAVGQSNAHQRNQQALHFG